jgi:hypothetical protein
MFLWSLPAHYQPSGRLRPYVQADGLTFFDFGIAPTGAIRDSDSLAALLAPVLDPKVAAALATHTVSSAGPIISRDESALVCELELQQVTGVPLPLDEAARRNIKSRLYGCGAVVKITQVLPRHTTYFCCCCVWALYIVIL